MDLVLLWLGLAVVVGVAANTRGRQPLGWFLLAVAISPLLAGLLVLALAPLPADAGPVLLERPRGTADRINAALRLVLLALIVTVAGWLALRGWHAQ